MLLTQFEREASTAYQDSELALMPNFEDQFQPFLEVQDFPSEETGLKNHHKCCVQSRYKVADNDIPAPE